MTEPQRIVVGISGASAPHYGIELLRALTEVPDVESHLVLSRNAHRTIELETELSESDVVELADVVHEPGNVAAGPSSGSFRTTGMIVAPCSMRTLSAISCSASDNLLTRAADVTLKERRPLVLMVRETPLHLGHLRLMATATEIGATILPPVPAFYHRPASIDDLIRHSVGKALELLGIEHRLYERWRGA